MKNRSYVSCWHHFSWCPHLVISSHYKVEFAYIFIGLLVSFWRQSWLFCFNIVFLGEQAYSTWNCFKSSSPSCGGSAGHLCIWSFDLWAPASNEQDGGCPYPNASAGPACSEAGSLWRKPSNIWCRASECCCGTTNDVLLVY